MRGTRISSGSIWEERVSYSRAVVLPDPGGDWVLVSGTTGYDYAAGTISDDPAEQARQCFANIASALEKAGSSLDDLVRIRVYVTSRAVFEAVADVIGEHCRTSRPANTTVIAPLVTEEMQIEIEVTARRAAFSATAHSE